MIRTETNGGTAISRDVEATTVAMILCDEVHRLAAGVKADYEVLIGELRDLADAVSLEVVCGRRENQERWVRLMNVRVRLAQLEAGLVMASHAGCIPGGRLRVLLSMVSAVRTYCFVPTPDQKGRFGRWLPS